MFFALALFAAARHVLGNRTGRRLALSATLATVLAVGWAYRAVGLHYNLRYTAEEQRAEWVHVDSWLTLQGMTLANERQRLLRDRLRADAIRDHPGPPQLSPAWVRWFMVER